MGIKLHDLRNAEYLALISQLLTHISDMNPAALHIETEYNNMETMLHTLSPLFNYRRGSRLTKDLQQADKRRDTAFTGIKLLIEAHLHHYEEKPKMSAKLLIAIVKMYGKKLTQEGFNAESALISSLVKYWANNHPAKEAIAFLGLTTWVTELEAANNAFEDVYMKRNSESSQQTKDRMKGRRVQANATYYRLRNMLLAYAEVNDYSPIYTNIINIWNEVLSNFNRNLKRRKNKNKKEGEEENEKLKVEN